MSSSLTHPTVTPSFKDRLRVWCLMPLLSVLAHAALISAVLGLSSLTAGAPKPKKTQPRSVTMRTIDSKRWAQNRGKNAPAIAQPEKPVELHPKGQVVDVAPGNEQLSPDAKYLAESNNRVKKQTVAREQTNQYSVATPKTSKNPLEMPGAKGHEAPSILNQLAADAILSPFGRRQPRLVDLFQKPSVGGQTENAQPTQVAGSESEEAPALGNTSTNEGGGAPNDDLHDVEQGDGTALNTREWKFASFFNRVKQAVSARWDPNGRLKSKNRQIGADRQTVMAVTLRPDGTIADLYVAKSSGIDELDQEAMRAFEKAQPFMNPPAALIEEGYIRFQFGFLVTTQGMAGFGSLFRPQ